MPRIYLRIGESEFEAEGEESFVEKHLKVFIDGGKQPKISREKEKEVPVTTSGLTAKGRTPAEFVRLKAPSTQKERLVILAKYLEEERGIKEYAQADINQLAGEAKLKAIHPQFFTDATKDGLLRTPSRGKYALSLSGEDFVNAMPRAAPAEA